MRTLRLSLAGTVILALLSAPTGVAVAQDEVTWPQAERYIAYGEDDTARQVIHAYRLEPRDAPRPAIVSFHGGGLTMGDPDLDLVVVPVFTGNGFVTFLAGYRLYQPWAEGANPWPTQLDDIQRAFRWIRTHADEFNVDPERICAGGYSAGGYLAALLGTMDTRDDSDPELAGISSRPDCVLMLAGDGDPTVPPMTDEQAETFAGYYGGSLDEHPELWEAASPAHHVDERTPPFLIMHGTQDEATSVESARNLVEALTEAGREVEYIELPTDHLGLGEHPDFWPAIEAFMVEHMRPAE
jgi:acetyl esterase/lipase